MAYEYKNIRREVRKRKKITDDIKCCGFCFLT